MEKYIILNLNGKAVQNWSFSTKRHIQYCQSPEWAMKFDEEKAAARWKDILNKNFPKERLVIMKIKIETTIIVG